jgi:hypothetical protein
VVEEIEGVDGEEVVKCAYRRKHASHPWNARRVLGAARPQTGTRGRRPVYGRRQRKTSAAQMSPGAT